MAWKGWIRDGGTANDNREPMAPEQEAEINKLLSGLLEPRPETMIERLRREAHERSEDLSQKIVDATEYKREHGDRYLW